MESKIVFAAVANKLNRGFTRQTSCGLTICNTSNRSVSVSGSAMIEAPRTNGRIVSGMSPCRGRRHHLAQKTQKAEDDGRIASKMCEGRAPDGRAPEVDGNDDSAFLI